MRSFPPSQAEMEALHSTRPITEETLPGPAPINIRQDDVAFTVTPGRTSTGEPTIVVKSTQRPDLNLTLARDLNLAMIDLQERYTQHTGFVAEHQAIADRALTQIKLLSQVETLINQQVLDGP